VLDAGRVLNRDGLRFPEEFVRHKILDLIGDLCLLGLPLEAHVRVEKGGHEVHQRLLAAIRANPSAWRIVGAPAEPLAEAFPVPIPAAVQAL